MENVIIINLLFFILSHAEDGPAVENFDGSQYWYVDDKLHRLDGPALICPVFGNEWWINGVRLSKEKENIMNIWWENRTRDTVKGNP